MLRLRCRARTAADLAFAALIALATLLFPARCVLAASGAGAAVPAPIPATEPALAGSVTEKIELMLEVWINGYKTDLIAPFEEMPGEVLTVSRQSLDELDLIVPVSAGTGERVRLNAIRGLTYRLDRAAQAIHLTVPEGMRRAKTYDVRPTREAAKAGRADYSALLNYSLFASASQGISRQIATGPWGGFNGANATLDARIITPYGIFTQTGLAGNIARYVPGDSVITDVDALRYETAFTYVDPETYMTYKAGDMINSSLSWTRPIRMGGFQVQRNFSARPDIVTQAFPTIGGSAAAPSSVDVFLNGVKAYSQQVAAGPFQFSNLPTVGGGEARVVVRDASGKEIETNTAFYFAPNMLRPGLYEASVEGGVARYNYGLTSGDYGERPIGSATLRAGITDWLTGEAHAEGGGGLANGGVGAVVNVANRGIVTAAVSGSLQSNRTGVQLFGSIDTKVGPVNIHAQTSRGLGKYADLSTATLRDAPSDITISTSGINGYYLTGYQPVISRDQVTLSSPVPFDTGNISASWVRSDLDGGSQSQVVSLSYSRPLLARANLFASAFRSIDAQRTTGAYAGISMPLGDVNISTSINSSSVSGTTYAVDAAKPLGYEPGDWGYRVRDSEGDYASRSAAVSYRSSKARLEASVAQDDSSVRETAEASGSLAVIGSSVYMANRIDDSFAVVNAGAPGVRVLADNRFVGETDSAGKILIPDLRSNQTNKIAIDPTNLSVSAEVDTPSQDVVPAYRSGVSVDFKVRREGSSAIVVLKKADGTFLDAGAAGKLEGSSESFLVGYDGQAFIRNLAAQNTVTVVLAREQCSASFAFKAKEGEQVLIGPVVCQ